MRVPTNAAEWRALTEQKTEPETYVEPDMFEGDVVQQWRAVDSWMVQVWDALATEGIHGSRVTMDIMWERMQVDVDKYIVHRISMRGGRVRREWTDRWRERARVVAAYTSAMLRLDKVTYDLGGFARVAHELADTLPSEAGPITVSSHPVYAEKFLVIVHAYGIDTVPNL